MTMKILAEHCLAGVAVRQRRGIGPGADPLGHLADYSGPTSDVGTPFGQGVADTYAWINKNGGINGSQDQCRHRRLRLPGAARHRPLQEVDGLRQGRRHPGWGTADTEALTGLPRRRQNPGYFGILCRGALRSDRRRRQGQASPLQLLLWPELLGRGARHADLGRGGLEARAARQAEIRPHGRQPPLSERTEGRR